MRKLTIGCVLCSMLCAAFWSAPAMATTPEQALVKIADRVVGSQSSAGAWRNEEDFTGSIVAGLIRAYESTGDLAYLDAAELGASYILDVSAGNFFGDEAYALARLAEATGEPAYADVVLEFYNSLDTAAYAAGFGETERSNAVFYVAHNTVAAHMVGATDAQMWRAALTGHLSQVTDDLAAYPVMSLGVATWALALTGPMDDTKVDPDGIGENYWADVKLSDLPDTLITHQVASGRRFAGSFYYRFDHMPADGDLEGSGYTEDTVFGLLGLIAANGATGTDGAVWDFGQEIQNARAVLADGVSAGSFVYNHIWVQNPMTDRYVFAGESLEAMAAPVGP